MSGLTFTLRTPPDQRLDLSPLTPNRLFGLDQTAIERIALNTTRTKLYVGDVFAVGMGDAGSIAIEGGSERFDGVGEGLAGGTLLLDGDAGIRAGRAMSAGTLTVRGSVARWSASGMTGGTLEVGGTAGDLLGGPLPGETHGMAGGSVIVRGAVGERAGDRMRRGLIVIEGAAGSAAASRMIAGTLIVCGTAGALPGYLMRRGTLVIGSAAAILPTFAPVGDASPVFTRLLASALRPASRAAAALLSSVLCRYMGDMASLGKGELLIPEERFAG